VRLTVALLAQGVDAPLGQGKGPTGLLGLGVTSGPDRPPHHHVRQHRRRSGRVAVEVDEAPGQCSELLVRAPVSNESTT
jgi:hypothetical protein